ncbi:hypothetical protein GCM10028808_30340 [Spirosoma migulaei]
MLPEDTTVSLNEEPSFQLATKPNGKLTITLLKVGAIVNLIRDTTRGSKLREIMQKSESDVKDANHLAFIPWSGILDERNQLVQPTGFIWYELHDVNPLQLDSLRDQLARDPYTFLLCTNLAGNGLLLVVRTSLIDPNEYDNYIRDYGTLLRQSYKLDTIRILIPPSPARRCPLGFDLQPYLNNFSQVWTPADPSTLQETVESGESDTYSPLSLSNRIDQAFTKEVDQVMESVTVAKKDVDQIIESVAVDECIGLFTIKTANKWIQEARTKPIPKMLYDEFWLEGEVCILFAESNQGKSILGVQIGDSISRGRPIDGFRLEAPAQQVLYLDFELTAKQFEKRYSIEYKDHYIWDDNFKRVEINPEAELPKGVTFDDFLNDSIETSIIQTGAKVLIVDNLTYLNQDTEAAKDAAPLMKRLQASKRKYGLSLLVLAHCPKRDASRPIGRNDLQGSSRLSQFADSMFAIGSSTKDSRIKYLKQIKLRSTAFRYDAENVMVCQIIHKPANFLRLEFLRCSTEQEHLKQPSEKDTANQPELVHALHQQGKTQTQIALELGISQPKVSRILAKLVITK